MRYRTMGKLDWQPSALGFGCMRLPVIDGDSKQINEPEAIAMIRKGIDLGINYVDTAYGYHGGNSEKLLAKALADGYRAKVKIATKLPMWLINEPGDADRYFEEQRERLGEEYIDFYLLHSLDRDRWATAKRLNLMAWAEARKAKGHIGHFGFSFHADLACFQDIIRGYDGWEFCQVQYNFMDTEYQAGTAGIKEAAERGLGVVVMEPLRGGMLALTPPTAVQQVWAKAETQRTPADWALQWVWNQPEVSLLLSGMSTMQHVVENVASAAQSGVGSLSGADLALIGEVRDAYRGLRPIDCTGCEYCLPCPFGVNIPRLFAAYNDANMYGSFDRHRRMYARAEDKDKASACAECGECLSKCPQHLQIPDLLKQVHGAFSPQDSTAG